MSSEPVKNVLVVLAAGLGMRYGSEIPKQYSIICGHEVLDWTMAEVSASKLSDKIVITLDNSAKRIDTARERYQTDVIRGGEDRAHSFQCALDWINAQYPECEKVVFHEAARPLVEHDIIDKYFTLLDTYDYVETCKTIVDSLGSYIEKAPRREDYYLIQAPEAYRIEVLNRYFDCESSIYFAANQFPSTCNGFRCFDVKNNYKLTNPEDKILFEALLSKKKFTPNY
jgi:2-C-methyl-D-erythritol 4-phosphate cytidylyltransferase